MKLLNNSIDRPFLFIRLVEVGVRWRLRDKDFMNEESVSDNFQMRSRIFIGGLVRLSVGHARVEIMKNQLFSLFNGKSRLVT